MQEEMLRSFQQMEDDFPRGFQGGFSISSPDLTEDEDQYRLEIALQGLQPKNFNIQVEKNHLRLQGSLVREEGGGSISSSFSRTFPVPPDVDADRIQIENQKDRLVVILPKKKN